MRTAQNSISSFSYYFSFLKNGLRIAQQEESGGLVCGVVQRLPNGIIRPE
jgi:hypothetical protein